VECEGAATAALRLLKTGPSKVSSSSSEAMFTTLLPFLRGAGVGEAPTRGIVAIGAEEAGAGMVWVVGGAAGAEAPAPAAMSSRRARTSTILAFETFV